MIFSKKKSYFSFCYLTEINDLRDYKKAKILLKNCVLFFEDKWCTIICIIYIFKEKDKIKQIHCKVKFELVLPNGFNSIGAIFIFLRTTIHYPFWFSVNSIKHKKFKNNLEIYFFSFKTIILTSLYIYFLNNKIV